MGVTDERKAVGEIRHVQRETEEIVRLVRQPKFAKYTRVQRIRRQLLNLQKISTNLRARAEALLSVE
jgi:hypothetical protein